MNNYDLILNGNDEFYPDINNKTYKIFKIDNNEKQIKMTKFILSFIDNQNKNIKEKHYIGIDLEFEQVTKDTKTIALMQINLENDSKDAHIVIFKPDLLSIEQLETIKTLLTHKLIFKILHGSESLDIPYIFNQLLETKEKIDDFCINFYDTKFLCEYYNVEHNKTESCAIYKLLENHKIITNNNVIKLNKIEEEMGEIQYIEINIHNMDTNLLKYALYDVIFLPQLLKKLLTYGEIYRFIIPEIIQIIFKSKRFIETELLKLNEIIARQNIYYIEENNFRFSLLQIYEIYLYQYFEFNDLIKVNYFKNFLSLVTKMVMYNQISKYNKIFMSKDHIYTPYNYDKFYKWLSKYSNIYNLIITAENKFKENELV